MISERMTAILSMLSSEHETTVKELARALYVSESTVRRDLALLSAQDQIVRTFRGAWLKALTNEEKISFLYRSNHNVEGKEKMARQAMQYIHENDVIMLDDSSSAMFLVPQLARRFKNLVVFTNGLRTAYALCECGIRNYMIGGWSMNLSQYSYMGPYAEQMLRSFHGDVAFFSCKGLSSQGIASSGLEYQDVLRQIMMSNCKTSVLLCDHTKVGKIFKHDFADVADLNAVVSDEPLPEALSARIGRRKLNSGAAADEYRIENA